MDRATWGGLREERCLSMVRARQTKIETMFQPGDGMRKCAATLQPRFTAQWQQARLEK